MVASLPVLGRTAPPAPTSCSAIRSPPFTCRDGRRHPPFRAWWCRRFTPRVLRLRAPACGSRSRSRVVAARAARDPRYRRPTRPHAARRAGPAGSRGCGGMGRDGDGHVASAGIYFCRLEVRVPASRRRDGSSGCADFRGRGAAGYTPTVDVFRSTHHERWPLPPTRPASRSARVGTRVPRPFLEMLEHRLGEPRQPALRVADPEPRRLRRLLARAARAARRRDRGVHLCMTRLKLLRLNTMGPIPDERLHSTSRRCARIAQRRSLHTARPPAPPAHPPRGRRPAPSPVVGRGARHHRRGAARRAGRAHGLLRHLARDRERDLLRVPEGGAADGLEPRRPVRAPVPRGERRRASRTRSAFRRRPARSRT